MPTDLREGMMVVAAQRQRGGVKGDRAATFMVVMWRLEDMGWCGARCGQPVRGDVEITIRPEVWPDWWWVP